MNEKINSIIEKGYIGTNIVQLDVVLIRDFHLPILTNFFYVDKNEVKKIYKMYSNNLFNFFKLKKEFKQNINRTKNEKRELKYLFNKSKKNIYLFNRNYYHFLNKSVLFKDILYSVYRNDVYSNIKVANNNFVIVKDTDFLLHGLLPVAYYDSLSNTPNLIPKFVKV